MNKGQTVFSQLIDFLPKHKFRQCVNRYRGNYHVRSFTCYDQLLCMAFAQLTYRESLRDIECCLRVMREKLYHMGIQGKISRSTLADANELRDWRIYSDFAQILIDEARKLYANANFGIELEETVYTLDASTVFPWAKFRSSKAAVKRHTLLNLRGNIPTFIDITDGKVHDVNVFDKFIPEVGAIFVMDRGYLDFERLYAMHLCPAFFIIRSKKYYVSSDIFKRC
jgi:hypothetical protein